MADPDPLLADAIRVLTRAFHEWPSDWAEFVSLATAGAAANVGGMERILSRRPGSWEADFCRSLLAGTVGWDGELLLEHRTDPVLVVLYPEELLNDRGVLDAYDRAWEELETRKDAAWPVDVDLVDLTPEQSAALTAAEGLQERLDALRDADVTAYGTALAAAVEAAAAGRGLTVPVHIEWEAGFRTLEEERAADAEPLALELLDLAVAVTPLPGARSTEEPPRPPLERLTDTPPTG